MGGEGSVVYQPFLLVFLCLSFTFVLLSGDKNIHMLFLSQAPLLSQSHDSLVNVHIRLSQQVMYVHCNTHGILMYTKIVPFLLTNYYKQIKSAPVRPGADSFQSLLLLPRPPKMAISRRSWARATAVAAT